VTQAGLPRTTTGGTCTFCQVVWPLEREHLFAEWIRGQLAQMGITGTRRHRLIKGLDMVIAHRWLNPAATHRVRCVCATCNHGWMKSLEERVMGPLGMLMRNGLKIVPVGDDLLRDLAAWAFKTAAVAQEQPSNHIRPIVAGARGYLYGKGEPPPNTVVWLSPTPEPDVDAGILLASLGSGIAEWGYLGQIVLGRISLAVIGSFLGRPLPFQPTNVFGVEAIEIWPNRPGWSRSPILPVLLQSGSRRDSF
jgi:hypothetical protein